MVEELVDVDDVLELVVDEVLFELLDVDVLLVLLLDVLVGDVLLEDVDVDVLLLDDALVLVLLAALVDVDALVLLVVVLLVTACVSSAVRDMACVLTKDDSCLLSVADLVQVPEVVGVVLVEVALHPEAEEPEGREVVVAPRIGME